MPWAKPWNRGFYLRKPPSVLGFLAVCGGAVYGAERQGLFDFINAGVWRWSTMVACGLTAGLTLFFLVRDLINPRLIRRFGAYELSAAAENIAVDIVRKYAAGEQINLPHWNGDLVVREAIRRFRMLLLEGAAHGG